MEHPKLGKLHHFLMEKTWEGKVGKYEIYIDQRPLDEEDIDFLGALDTDCERLALKELENLDGLLARIEIFLETASEPYLDIWATREWELFDFVATKKEGKAVFIVEYFLIRDDYNVWQVRVENGHPVSINRR